MARPKLGDSESKRLQMVITEDELKAVEDWQFNNRVPSKSEAIRRLIKIALMMEEWLGDTRREIEQASEGALGLIPKPDPEPEWIEKFEAMYHPLIRAEIGVAAMSNISAHLRINASMEDAVAAANVMRDEAIEIRIDEINRQLGFVPAGTKKDDPE